MSDLKRLEVKYIRDKVKGNYIQKRECYICGTTKDLQLHHFHSLTLLWEKWKKDNNIDIDNIYAILEVRDRFIEECWYELVEDVVTLCKFHHMERLHKLFGKVPLLHTASKQRNWCDIRREKEYKK